MRGRRRNTYLAPPTLKYTPSVVPAQLGRDRAILLPDNYPADETRDSYVPSHAAIDLTNPAASVAATVAEPAEPARPAEPAEPARPDGHIRLPRATSGLGWPSSARPARWERPRAASTITLP